MATFNGRQEAHQNIFEQGLGAKAIRNAYSEKGWPIATVKKICRRVDSCGSAIELKLELGDRELLVLLRMLRRLKNCFVPKKVNQARERARGR